MFPDEAFLLEEWKGVSFRGERFLNHTRLPLFSCYLVMAEVMDFPDLKDFKGTSLLKKEKTG